MICLLLFYSSIALAHTAVDTVDVTEVFVEAATDSVTADELPVYKDRKFDKKFKDKYTAAEFQYEPKAVTKTWWDRFLESLARFLDRIFSSGGTGGGLTVMGLLVKLVVIVVIGFVVYLIVRAVLNKQSLWIFGRSRKKIDASELNQEDLKQMDFPKLVSQSSSDGQYNLAIRYYFLWVLKKLADREIIDWHWDKTNSDYLYEIKNSTLRKDFEYLAYVYDYSWYGNFPIDTTAFAKAEKAFQKTLNTL